MKQNKSPNDHLWLAFIVEILLIIGSVVFYKTSERIPESYRPMTVEEQTRYPKE